MLIQELLFGIIGGLGLFLFGIHLMGEGLQKLSRDKIRTILSRFTNNRLSGVLVGAGVTSLIQSSSATTVIVVGFINAGLMTLRQSIGIILGANIGTTITAQLIAFKLTTYALLLVGLGSFLYFFSRKRKYKDIGETIFGFGTIFLGLNIITKAISPLSTEGGMITSLFLTLSHNPLLAVLVGLIVTAIVQSSSVTTGITIALASAGLIDINAAIPLVFGTNIGTCVTAILASINTTISAKRAAVAHVLFNVAGVLIAFILLPLYTNIVIHISPTDVARQIANTHTLFNIINTLIFLPFIPLYAKLITKLIPGEDIVITSGPRYLEKHLIKTPSIAISAATKEMLRMVKLTNEMIKESMEGFFDNNSKILARILPKERETDSLQEAITNYLVNLTQEELSQDQSEKIPALLHSVNDIERIGDHAMNIVELAERKMDNKLVFSEEAIAELKKMQSIINRMFTDIIQTLDNKDLKAAKRVLTKEEEINLLTMVLRQNHIERLNSGKCNILSGVVFLDIVMNLEKIGDHLTNIAQASLGSLKIGNNHIKNSS